MEQPHDEEGQWSSSGEVPSTDPDWLKGPARQHFLSRARSLGHGLSPDHKVVTTVDQETHSVVGGHRKEIIVGAVALTALSVAGLLAARHHLRLRPKK